MQQLMSIEEALALGCERWQTEKAAKSGKQMLRIVWDKAEYGLDVTDPLHGYVQWSARPFTPRQGCDGTIDAPVHLLSRHFCDKLGLDYAAHYRAAYPGEDMWEPTPAKRAEPCCLIAEWPEPSDQALRDLLYDLGDINNGSLLAALQASFEALGFDVDEWWSR